MKKYIFTDTDYEGRGEEEHDITGEDYKELIRTCAKYCESFAFVSGKDNSYPQIPLNIQKYAIDVDASVKKRLGYRHFAISLTETMDYGWIFHFKICDETIDWLLSVSSDIYNWYFSDPKNSYPEDLTFYRKDGSAFFGAMTHEGYCELTVCDDEDVSHIISKDHWLYREPGMMWYREL